GLWWKGPAPEDLRFAPDAVLATPFAGAEPDWGRWALEPLDAVASEALVAPDAPAGAVAVTIAAAGGVLSPDRARDAVAAHLGRAPADQEVADALLVAWELGFLRPVGA